jgi:hypothetical protein
MDNLYKELTETGIAFIEFHFRTVNHRYNGGGDEFACHGILEDFENDTITDERLAGVLTLAKKKKTYLVINPKAKEIEIMERGKRVTRKLRENEMAATFIQAGIFRAFAASHAETDTMLKRHFLHYQEDTSILELELKLESLANQLHLWTLSGNAYNISKLDIHSEQLRGIHSYHGAVMTYKKEIETYASNHSERKSFEIMYIADMCLRRTCSE